MICRSPSNFLPEFIFPLPYICSGTLDTAVVRPFYTFQKEHNTIDAAGFHDLDMNAVDTFYVYHKDKLVNLYKLWANSLPTITPYYAIKCNPDPMIMDVLAECGASFDAASPAEIEAALDRVPPSRIIYANPCKCSKDITHAAQRGVGLTVFDSVGEFDKIISETGETDMKMLFRIYANDPSAQCVLSNKYGATKDEWEPILKHIAAQPAAMSAVVGVSFHIGSGANDPQAFVRAIAAARTVFDMSADMGFEFSVLDIGGGFTAGNITAMAPHINCAVAEFNQTYPNVSVIAEPGRYFAENVADFYTKIIGVRSRADSQHYWINDSLYGSFNCILYDHAAPTPTALTLHGEPQHTSTIWGATCDGFDKIMQDTKLPPLSTGDWLLWKNMGAYTQAGASRFNGLPFADAAKVYV